MAKDDESHPAFVNWVELARELETAEHVERRALKQVIKARRITNRLKTAIKEAVSEKEKRQTRKRAPKTR